MKFEYTPTFNNILVEPIIATRTHNGFLLTQELYDEPKRGRVLAVGPGKLTKKKVLIEPEIKVGDVVVYPRQDNDVKEVNLEGKVYNIVSEDLIYGVE